MPFEYPENRAAGKYNYQQILNRLHDIKGKLEKRASNLERERP